MYALWIKNTSESDPRSCEATKAVAKESPEKILVGSGTPRSPST